MSVLPSSSSAPGNYQCSLCLKRYKRREHLFRHSISHTSERPFQCLLCDATFQREDVLKRHSRTCEGGTSGRPTRRRACDHCVRLKKACSSHLKCQSCSRRGIPCTCTHSSNLEGRPNHHDDENVIHSDNDLSPPNEENSGLSSTILSTAMTPFDLPSGEMDSIAFTSAEGLFDPIILGCVSPSWQDYLAMISETQPPQISASDTNRPCLLPFLDRFTSRTGFASTFECGTREQREQVASLLKPTVALPQHFNQPSLPGLSPDLVSSPWMAGMGDASAMRFLPLDWLTDPLSLKTHEILLLIEEVVTVKPRNSVVTLDWSAALKNECLQFFSPVNLRRFLDLYWAIWHPNVNLVHRPTFDYVSAKPTVLAAMALIGACVSLDMADNEAARTWFNCVEEIVFIDDDFNDDLNHLCTSNMAIHRRKIQSLQAAFMVCLYQNFEGTDASKSRIRRYRFATLVSTARDIGSGTARHLTYSEQGRHEFEWKEFAAREELIRIFTWVLLLDTAFVIFNNLPPRFVIKEMKMHMAMPEACFQAMTADQCYQQILMFLPMTNLYWKLSFRCVFAYLCKDDLPTDVQQFLASLGPLNLFALTSAIHSQIFQLRSSVIGYQLFPAIRNAISHWRDSWQAFTSLASTTLLPHIIVDGDHIQPEMMWKRVGFCRHSPEYWLLANLIADRLATSNPFDPPSSEDELEPLDESPLDPVLNKYDQTSMRQVNDLISGFQAFQI